MGARKICGACGGEGHNRRTCKGQEPARRIGYRLVQEPRALTDLETGALQRRVEEINRRLDVSHG